MTASLPELVARLRYKPGWRFRLMQGNTTPAAVARYTWDPGQVIAIGGDVYGNGTTGPAAIIVPGQEAALFIEAQVADSGNPDQTILVLHQFTVDSRTWDSVTDWERWLFARIEDVERHEAMEFFQVGGDRPFYPEHGPDADLYTVKRRQVDAVT